MASKQLIDIIIKATDEASATAKKVDDSFRRMGKSGSNSAREFDKSLLQANNSLSVVGGSAVNATNLLHQMQLDPNFASTMDRAKLKTSQMGYSLDSAKGKIMTFANAGKMSFDNIRNKVTTTATSIKSKFNSAVDSAKAKLRQLGESARQTSSGIGLLEMTVGQVAGMVGFELVARLFEAGKSSMESASKLDYFAGRLKMSGEKTQQFRNDLDELQQRFRKVDMTAVGASAEELSVKLGMGSDSLKEMSETLAVASSAFVAEGRTQEDAILAVSDAIDGQWMKLKELGITQEDIKNNGWNGDLNDKKSLLEGLNNTLEKMGFTKTAEDIVTLDDAFQALSVAGGILIQKVLVPLTPLLLQIMGFFLDLTYSVQGVVQYISDNGWLQGALLIGVVTVALLLFYGAVLSAEGGLMGLVATAIPSFIMSLYGVATALWTAEAPLLPIIIILGLLALAIYEIGIAFGWWTDIGSMIGAITNGIGRLWNAFINHPDVQGAIKVIGDAFNGLIGWISWAGREILKFFGISSSNKWDIVRSIIDGVGNAWNTLKSIISPIIGVLQSVISNIQTMYAKWGIIGAILGIISAPIQVIVGLLRSVICALIGCSPGIVPALQLVYEIFSMVWGAIWSILSPIVNRIVMGIRKIIAIFDQYRAGQISLPQLIYGVLSQLLSIYISIFTYIGTLVLNFAKQMLNRAIQTGRNFVNGIINWLKQLPSKVLAFLLQVLRIIVDAGQQWINTAKQKAKSIVDGVYNALINLPSKITSALSGVVNAITKPFKDAYDGVVKQVDKIKKKAEELTGIDLPMGGEPLAYGGEIATSNGVPFNIATGQYIVSPDNSPIVIEDKISLTLDLQNVPSHIDTGTLIEALSDKKVVNALATNRDFQDIDAQVKQKINLKTKRSGY